MRQKSGSVTTKTRPSALIKAAIPLALASLVAFGSPVIASTVFVGGADNRSGSGLQAVQIDGRQQQTAVQVQGSRNDWMPATHHQVAQNSPPMPTVMPGAHQERIRVSPEAAPAPSVNHLQLNTRAPGSIHITDTARPKSDAVLPKGQWWSGSTGQSQRIKPASVSATVPAGWLSEGMRGIAEKAGYSTLVWALDDTGRKDFQVHAPLTLEGEEYLELLYELSKPYPIRLCLYATDKVAEVVMEGKSCNSRGEAR
ncbi:MAG: hypothetical protein IBX50_06025 [Marinospirillum sp.]|uniref:hypothetical protein n=1 Tax=Marinospirillum sp. TaxID=2183934 RepID=UPI001A02CCDA|nr:hypothetical protein [Marinospirillum sp.]MBE0506264.1 hypothetical protein [Marinospirillum sp.]